MDILAPGTDPTLQLSAQKMAVELALTLGSVANGGGSQSALLTKLAAAYASGAPVDLTNPDTLTSLFTGVGLSASAASSLALSTASSANAVANATSLGGVSQVQQDAADPTQNVAPTVRPDAATTAFATAVTVDVLANDVDVEGSKLTITAVNGTAITATTPVAVTGGSVSLVDGKLVFAPAFGFVGSSNFTYTTSDGTDTSIGKVSVGVSAPGDTFGITAATLDTVIANASILFDDGVRHLDVLGTTVGGNALTLTDAQAAALSNAGLDFVDNDVITVDEPGTTSGLSLKKLQDLKVDIVKGHATNFSIDAGAGGLGGLSADQLPSFTVDQSDAQLNVTLNIGGGTLDSSVDTFHLAPALGASGIDHINVTGDGHLTLSADQALAFGHSGVDFNSANDITANFNASQIAAVVGGASDLAAAHVDHLDVIGDTISIDDGQAAALIGAGLDFVDSDDVTVEAHGTHLSTSLGGLQSLHVDTITGDGINSTLKLALGDIDGSSDLPTFAAALDVTVDLSAADVAGLTTADLTDLTATANKLAAAGVDHIGINQSFDTLTQDQLDAIAQITHDTGLNFVYDPTPAASGDFGTLLSLLEAHPVEATVPNEIAVSDAATASLVESGALQSFLGETLVVDATDSDDLIKTSLKTLGDLGVDEVKVADHGTAPVYVDLGFGSATPTSAELAQLLNTVDPSGTHEPLFSGTAHVGLVVDQAGLDALAGVNGSLDHLVDIGFTEVDVLGGTKVPDALAHNPAIEIKLIGIDDELYDHLHHDK